jgi:hypothetical protein
MIIDLASKWIEAISLAAIPAAALMHVIITCSSLCECVDLKVPSQAPKSGAAKTNSDCGKRVKASVDKQRRTT